MTDIGDKEEKPAIDDLDLDSPENEEDAENLELRETDLSEEDSLDEPEEDDAFDEQEDDDEPIVRQVEEEEYPRSSSDDLIQDELIAEDVLDRSAGREGSGQASRSDHFDRNKKVNSARELFTDEIRLRVERANSRLRTNLTGRIIFEIDGGREKYLFDWSTEKVNVEATDLNEADCIIRISEDNLMRVASGDLNPQVGMLSDKIFVSGRLGLAIYIFNLIAPRQFMH